jgi:NADPH:quinone reductase-like Zn-dependent oxidoreductase
MEREVLISRFGGPEVLELRERILKEPKDHEVAIKVKACGINFADIVMRIGLYKDAPPRPFVPGYEVSGIIDKVGKNVKDFKAGDNVIAATFLVVIQVMFVQMPLKWFIYRKI